MSENTDKRLTRFEKWQLIFSGVQAVILSATLIAAICIGVRQNTINQELLELNKGTIKNNREMSELIEAAVILPDSFSCSTLPQKLSRDTEISILFRNSGRSTARDITLEFHISIRGSPIKPAPEHSKLNLATGATIGSTALLVGDIVTDNEFPFINEGAFQLEVSGFVEFIDVFDHKHRLDYEAYYLPNTPCDFAIKSVVQSRVK